MTVTAKRVPLISATPRKYKRISPGPETSKTSWRGDVQWFADPRPHWSSIKGHWVQAFWPYHLIDLIALGYCDYRKQRYPALRWRDVEACAGPGLSAIIYARSDEFLYE